MQQDGLVLPGNKNIGLFRFNDHIYSFAGLKEAKEFAKAPKSFIEGLVERAKSNPDLIQLLHLYLHFPTVDALERVSPTPAYPRRDRSTDKNCWGRRQWYLKWAVK